MVRRRTIKMVKKVCLKPPFITFYSLLMNLPRFSIHEMAVYDLPASIAKVLSVSGKQSITYIGHSMGTTAFLAMCSCRVLAVNMVELAVLLAPVVEPRGIKSTVLQGLSKVHGAYWTVWESAGVLEIFPDWEVLDKITKWTLSQFLMAVR